MCKVFCCKSVVVLKEAQSEAPGDEVKYHSVYLSHRSKHFKVLSLDFCLRTLFTLFPHWNTVYCLTSSPWHFWTMIPVRIKVKWKDRTWQDSKRSIANIGVVIFVNALFSTMCTNYFTVTIKKDYMPKMPQMTLM